MSDRVMPLAIEVAIVLAVAVIAGVPIVAVLLEAIVTIR